MTRLHVATAATPGAIALLQLHGHDAPRILATLTGRDDWTAGRVRRCEFAEIDEGLAVVLSRPGRDDATTTFVQLMPHGGPRVIQRLVEHLVALGCTYDAQPDPRDTYPEADSAVEADMLDAIAHATSPVAIDLLASQPERWRALRALPDAEQAGQRGRIAERLRVLDRLSVPPTVVVAGPANVGKSTLTNALSGRALSIVADLPGTTRDWVGGLVELDGVAVQWLDTPGLRVSGDRVEQRAIAVARRVVENADVLIAMRDAGCDWPAGDALPRTPDLWVLNKCDDIEASEADHADGLARSTPDNPLRLSAQHGHGLPALRHLVLSRLGLTDLDDATPWAFSPTLQAWAVAEPVDLATYLSV